MGEAATCCCWLHLLLLLLLLQATTSYCNDLSLSLPRPSAVSCPQLKGLYAKSLAANKGRLIVHGESFACEMMVVVVVLACLAYTHICTHTIHTCTHTHARMHKHIHVRATYMHACTRTRMYTHLHACAQACIHAHMHTCMHIHACMHAYPCAHMHACLVAYPCAHMHVIIINRRRSGITSHTSHVHKTGTRSMQPVRSVPLGGPVVS